jgi:hypothetical protein
LDGKKGNKEKGEVIYPSHFFEDLAATAFRTVFFPYEATVHFDLTGFGTKYDEHQGLARIRITIWAIWRSFPNSFICDLLHARALDYW